MPLLAIFALVLVARPLWRRQVGLALPVLSAGLALATFLAKESGEGAQGLCWEISLPTPTNTRAWPTRRSS